MRIQHNIMAMSAYRNYNTNTSAVAKNLEKLSSGYKINRAGDDAAGLAISEKMRAQITGLNAAQKNVKDGISLVKTAEGAMQEIQDMLNRMDYLATQSANGTYDNEVDRAALQKEVNQLKSEINRIADSANFNGIKLLDGSQDAGGRTTVTKGEFQIAANHGGTVATGNITLPAVGQTLGTDTVLHAGATSGATKNEFSVELHDLEYTNATGSSMKLTIGDDEFTLAAGAQGTADTKLTAADIAAAFGSGKFTDANGTMTANKATIGGVEYDVTVSGTKITFTTTEDLPEGTEIPATVTVSDPNAVTTAAKADKYVSGAIGYTAATGGAADGASTATVTYKDADGNNQTATVNFNASTDAATTAGNLLTALQGDAALSALFDIAGDDTGISFTAKTAGADKGSVTNFALGTTGDGAATDVATIGTKDTANSVAGADETTADSNIKGDYNVSTTDIVSKVTATDKRLASTHFTLTNDMVTDGSTLTIGTKTYTFTTDKNKIGQEGYVDATSGDLATIAKNLTDAVAANNTTYTLGTDATAGHITITEKDGQTDFDLTTMDGIEKSLGFSKAATSDATGKGLTLQIGDTSDSYNQLKVSVGDMHTVAMGIDSLDISNQAGAAAAIQTIRDAINYVSGVRGDLGATQNRLEHTANNLSVMAENIQDAESTIRDTDIAEEMMSYTKNNILVQSAQAMLAQANQVPQGVLQLLG